MNKIILKMKNTKGANFIIHNPNKFTWTDASLFFLDKIEDKKFFNNFKYTELKANLDLENEGSSKKHINDLINKKISPNNDNDKLVINIDQVYNFITSSNPKINKTNIMVVYNMLISNMDNFGKEDNGLEDPFDWRQGKGGFVKKFKTPPVSIMKQGMSDLIEFINSNTMDDYPIEKAAVIQTIFIYYHPFYDFNGKTGRILSNWYLKNRGYGMLSELITFSVSHQRKKYIKVWDMFRKFDDSSLDFWINWLSLQVQSTVRRVQLIHSRASKEGKVLNKNQIVIIFNLMETDDWLSIDQIKEKIDIGVSRTAIDNSIIDLVKQGVFESKEIKRKKLVKNTWTLKSGLDLGELLSFLIDKGSFEHFPTSDELRTFIKAKMNK